MASNASSDALSPSGRRVIVTGASGGIGRATVELLERAGCAVAGCDVDDFDVRDRTAVEAGVAALVERLGGSVVTHGWVEERTTDELLDRIRATPL